MEDVVLRQAQAVEFLEDTAHQHVDLIMKGEEDLEGFEKVLDDLKTMREQILEKDMEWVKIFECRMSASNINIKEMIER